jgi:hypothetical protein
MPVIVKMKYVRELLAALAANKGMSHAEIAATLNKPTAGVPVVGSVTTAAAVAVLSADALAKMRDITQTATAEVGIEKDFVRSAAIAMTAHLDAGEVSLVEGSEGRKVVDTLAGAGFINPDEMAKLLDLATAPGDGPSAAMTFGLGVCDRVFVAQVAEYEGMTEDEIKGQLAGLLLASWLRPWLSQAATAEDVLALPEYAKFRDEVILPYTELADAKAADVVMAEVLKMMQEVK